MAQTASSSSSTASTSFASLLDELTSPTSSVPGGRAARDKNDFAGQLEDDVITLTYESALRANARYKPDYSDGWMLPEKFGAMAALAAEESAARKKPPGSETVGGAAARINRGLRGPLALDEKRRCASVTVRLSETESAQLQERAAEAGLTVSAYLRSCTFEAEALRAQVKAALAELKGAQSTAANAAEIARASLSRSPSPETSWPQLSSPRTSWFRNSLLGWVTRLLPRRHFGQSLAIPPQGSGISGIRSRAA